MTTDGALYIAYGEQAKAQLQISLRSLQKFAPHLPVAVISDTEQFGARTILQPAADPGARFYKTQMYRFSPFERTLFLDADTELRASPAAGFNLLGYVDLVLGQDVNRNFAANHWPHLVAEEVAATAHELGTAHFMYYNTGVIFFRRNPQVEALMTAWHTEWQRWKAHDQMAFLRANVTHPARIAPMRAPWNTHIPSQVAFVYHKHRAARQAGAPR